MKDVGIVMPIYNQDPELLKVALNSILQQTYKNFQLVIVIDGANDQTRNSVYDLVKNVPMVKIIDKTINEGVSKALNTGFDFLFNINEIKFLTWVSSDNIYYETFIEKLRDKLIHSSAEVGLVYSSFHHLDSNGKSIHTEKELIQFREFQQNKNLEDLLEVCFIGVSFMYKKMYAQQISGYYFEPIEDYEYWLRLTEVCNIEYISEELMGYRMSSPLSISKDIHSDKIKHRWWRDQFNLAKNMAIKRRNLSYETTVLFCVTILNDQAIQDLEILLDQLYYGFWIIIIDETGQMKTTLKNLQINDSRIKVVETTTLNISIIDITESLNSTYALIYSNGFNLKGDFAFSNLVNEFKKIRRHNKTEGISAYYEDNSLKVCIRTNHSGWNYNEIYNTHFLKKLMLNRTLPLTTEIIPPFILNSIPKSGTNLVTQLLLGITSLFRSESQHLFEGINTQLPQHFNILNQLIENEFIVGHIYYSPEWEAMQKNLDMKQIFVYRDPRDIIVSHAYFFDKLGSVSPNNLLYQYVKETGLSKKEQYLTLINGVKLSTGNYPNIYEVISIFTRWIKSQHVLAIRFEDIMSSEQSRYHTCEKIINYLFNKKPKDAIEIMKKDMSANINKNDTWTFRNGQIGDWKKEFDKEVKDSFKRVAGNLLIELGYEKDMDW